jgi:hypothetical protein
MRAASGRIFAPPFPDGARWLNVATLRMDKQIGRPVLIEFFDVCRVPSLRTLPYLQEWDRRYPQLRVISIHTPGYEISASEELVAESVARLRTIRRRSSPRRPSSRRARTAGPTAPPGCGSSRRGAGHWTSTARRTSSPTTERTS